MFTYNQAAISWASKKQNSVAISSCEAEIMALSEAAKEGVFLRRFLDELGLGSSSPTSLAPPTSLATDNKAARDLACSPEHHEKTKHIERRHFYVRELVENEELIVPFVSTTSKMADFFTKPLAGEQFYRLRSTIMNHPSRSESRAARACAEAPAPDSRAPFTPATGCSSPAPESPLVHSRFVCPARRGGRAGLVKGEPCYVCGGCGYHVGQEPAVPSAGGCREPRQSSRTSHRIACPRPWE